MGISVVWNEAQNGLGAALGPTGIAVALIAAGLTAGLTAGPAAAETKAKDRLAGDLELLTAGQMEDNPIVPKGDRKRTAKCLAQALVTDIPEEDAARLSRHLRRPHQQERPRAAEEVAHHRRQDRTRAQHASAAGGGQAVSGSWALYQADDVGAVGAIYSFG